MFSGVVEYLSSGGVAENHKDFKELRYSDSLTNFNCNGKNPTSNGRITHGFKLKSTYEEGLMPYTNYTYDFKVSPDRPFAVMGFDQGSDEISCHKISRD